MASSRQSLRALSPQAFDLGHGIGHAASRKAVHNRAMSELSHSIADLRKSYERAELNESASAPAPIDQFDRWMNEAVAAQVPEPNAMTVATVGANARPSTRIGPFLPAPAP